jgi:TonB family protein
MLNLLTTVIERIRMIAMQQAAALCICLVLVGSGFAEQEKATTTTASQEVAVEVGPGITPPHPVFTPDPEYPESFRKGKHKIQGTCVLGLTVDKEGLVQGVHVTRSLDKRLDQNAIDAVKRWKFKPAMRDSKPVAVLTSVELDFRLY